MMKISQREMYLGVAALACVLIGSTWYGASGKVEAWKAKKTDIANLRLQISRNQAAIKQQDAWLGQLKELEKDLRIFETDQRSVSPELMKTIKSISDKYALNITRNQPHEEKPTGNLFELAINCTWEGSVEAVVGFLTELQQQGIRYDIRTLNITPAGKTSGDLKGNMVINCAFTRQTAPDRDAE